MADPPARAADRSGAALDAAVEQATGLVNTRFPDAVAAWLGGSTVSGTATATSDLDITVLLAGPPAPYRESLLDDGRPVELFVHTETSLEHYCSEDLARRHPTMLRLVGESAVLVDRAGRGRELRSECRQRLLEGPPAPTAEQLASMRYAVTDLLDDLLSTESEPGRVAVAAELWQQAARLRLAGAGRWEGTGKWLANELRGLDADEGVRHTEQLVDGLRAALGGDVRPLAAVVEQILGLHGGRRFSGHRLAGVDPVAGLQ